MVGEAYRIGVKQLGEKQFEAKVDAVVAAVTNMLDANLSSDPNGMVTALVALDQMLRRDADGLRKRIATWAGLDKDPN
jgi:hypothetical protein